MYSQLTANLCGSARKVTFNGRAYYVVPVRMIKPGVLNGSKGPLYYPLEEIRKNYDAWNGMPIVLGHPTVNGEAVSARYPEILEKYQLGFVFNAKAGDNLDAEAWLDIELCKKLDGRIITAIEANNPIELSTGLFTEDSPVAANSQYNGTPYSAVARNYRPDHLAILLDEVGACSLKDGCGVLVNSSTVKKALDKALDFLGLSEQPTDNELSHYTIKELLRDKLLQQSTQDQPRCYVAEVYDGYFIFEKAEQLFKQGYSKSDTGVTLVGAPVPVMRKVDYVTANEEKTEKQWYELLGAAKSHSCKCQS